VAWYGPNRSWFVSNTRPSSDGKTEGWIARLDGGDKRAEPFWLRDLRAPRGMAVAADRLYVADLGEVVVVDIATRAVQARHPVPRARLLYGVAADDQGNVYVSDVLANTIYRLPGGGAPAPFVASDRLAGPTGMTTNGADLIVASWGTITDATTLSTRAPGGLWSVGLQSKDIRSLGPERLGHLDGVARKDDGYLVTDRRDGKLLWVSPSGATRMIREGLQGPGGIAVEPRRGVVAVPERDRNNVVFVSVK
jgi:sugar lactone lactonase YvrE